MNGILLNFGAGPVPEATYKNAMWNTLVFIDDITAAHGYRVVRMDPGSDKGGRWSFRLLCDGIEHTVEMPGLPLEQVRYTGYPQNPFHFTRLYLDGSSWLWNFAVDQCVPPEPEE